MWTRVGSIAAGVVVLAVVAGCGDEARDAGVSDKTGQCSAGGAITALDIPGPGRPTPQDAVEPYLGEYVVVGVQEDGETAIITAEAPDGDAVRVYDLTRRKDGWWPDGYTEC